MAAWSLRRLPLEMERADVASLANAVREAFLAAGRDVEEKRTVTGQAFFFNGRAVGQVDVRANVVRTRLWLPTSERRSFEARPTFDPESGWLHVVSGEDVAFARGLLAAALHAAEMGGPAAPPAPRAGRPDPAASSSGSLATRAAPEPRPSAARSPAAEKIAPEKKKRAASAALSRPKRTRG